MFRKKVHVEELIAIIERERVLELSEDDANEITANYGLGVIVRLSIPARYPKRDGFMKVLRWLWGSDGTSYAEIGTNAMVVRFTCYEERRRGSLLQVHGWSIIMMKVCRLARLRLVSFVCGFISIYNLPLGCFTRDRLRKI